ncbi:TPA: DUF4153 domain-containing protein, partial [Mannheimia haemolytica]|nr:DUF4153 domain-containing protein [Mannheimia haemolytica]
MLSKLQRFTLMIKSTIIKHPLEILFVTYVTILLINNVSDYELIKRFQNLIALFPICFILLYLIRDTKAYWLFAPIPIAIVFFFGQINLTLLEDSRYWATIFCVFLCLISQYWYKNNHYFVAGTTNKLVNIVFATVLSGIIFATLSAITIAIIALFDLNKQNNFHIFEKFGIFSSFWAFPVLFLTLEQQTTNDSRYLNRISEMLLNWILSPALIIYTAIIYAYVIFIAAKGQMPDGVVANVALPYLAFGLAIQAVQLLLKNAKWQWFYSHFTYLALLPLTLIWYAIYIRFSHYGLTEARIYLVIGTITLSICYTLLLFKQLAQYRLFSAVSIAIILISVFILDPKTVALKDQTKRLDNYLLKHKLLDVNNKISTKAVLKYQESLNENRDEAEYFYSMLHYVARGMPAAQFKEKYGVNSSYDLMSEIRERNTDPRYFEATNSELVRLTKADMANAREYITFSSQLYRPNSFSHQKIENKLCQKLLSQGYYFEGNILNIEYQYSETAQDCSSITQDPTEFVIYFKGLGTTIEFNINDILKKIFAKHQLSITQQHKNEVLEKIKGDLLKMDLGNSVLGLKHIELRFE